jgi:hypothetical protein
MKTNRQAGYNAPSIDMIEITTEQGFANSYPTGGVEDPGDVTYE